jgi:ATP-dependent RNA helicase DHX29
MAKKKSKVASNRGYATVSAPSKKLEPVVASQPTASELEAVSIKQEHPFESLLVTENLEKKVNEEDDEDQDPVMKLVKKYESLNDHKAQVALDRMLKNNVQQQNVLDENVKKIRLTADLEKDLLQVIKHKDNDSFGRKELCNCSLIYFSIYVFIF